MKQTEDVNIDCLFHFLFWKKAWWNSQPLREPACNLLIELLTDWWDNWQVCQTDRKSVRWPASRPEPGRSARRWRRSTANPSLSRRSGLRSGPSVKQCWTKHVMSFTTQNRNNNVNPPLPNGKYSFNIYIIIDLLKLNPKSNFFYNYSHTQKNCIPHFCLFGNFNPKFKPQFGSIYLNEFFL